MFLRDPSHYRLRLLKNLLETIGVPVALLYLGLTIFKWRLGALALLCYPCFIIAWASLMGTYDELRQKRAAEKLHTALIPRVVGKLPGNVDVLWKMMRNFKESYIQEVYLQFFRDYGCTTLNLRILWRDNVSYRSALSATTIILLSLAIRELMDNIRSSQWTKSISNLFQPQGSSISGEGILKKSECRFLYPCQFSSILMFLQGAFFRKGYL